MYGVYRIEVKTEPHGKLIAIVHRTARFHSGWQSVVYKNKRYVLHGGIRTPNCIYLNNPIVKGR